MKFMIETEEHLYFPEVLMAKSYYNFYICSYKTTCTNSYPNFQFDHHLSIKKWHYVSSVLSSQNVSPVNTLPSFFRKKWTNRREISLKTIKEFKKFIWFLLEIFLVRRTCFKLYDYCVLCLCSDTYTGDTNWSLGVPE